MRVMCVRNGQSSVCACTHIHIWGESLTAVNVSIPTGFIALRIYTHICIGFPGDRVGSLEQILVWYQ